MPRSAERWARLASAENRALAQFLFAFAAVFTGLALLPTGVGPFYARAHAALGNWLVGGEHWASGVSLHFDAARAGVGVHPWQVTLAIVPRPPAVPISMPIELRTLMFLPTVTFVALAAAMPLASWRKNVALLALGCACLEPLLLLLLAAPVVSFLAGTGPIHAFTLNPAVHVAIELVYRVLVVPPGMTYAVPLLLWWVLLSRFRARSTTSPASSVRTPPSEPVRGPPHAVETLQPPDGGSA